MQKHRFLSETAHGLVSQEMQVGSGTEPFSREALEKVPRIRDAQLIHSVCLTARWKDQGTTFWSFVFGSGLLLP